MNCGVIPPHVANDLNSLEGMGVYHWSHAILMDFTVKLFFPMIESLHESFVNFSQALYYKGVNKEIVTQQLILHVYMTNFLTIRLTVHYEDCIQGKEGN